MSCPFGYCDLTHEPDVRCDDAANQDAFETIEEMKFERERGN